MYEHHSQPPLSARAFVWRMVRHFAWSLALFGGSLGLGVAGYMQFAHFGIVDAFLNASMLLGGMGPIGDLPNDAAKIFAGCYALYAGLVFIAGTGLLVVPVAHRLLHKLHLSR